MKFKRYFLFILLIMLIHVNLSAMESENFKIEKSVMSGGGGTMASGTGIFNAHTVLGQPTPLITQGVVPGSENFDLYPGYIYSIHLTTSFCLYDSNQDGDVDGEDLVEFIRVFDLNDIERFAEQFGETDCF